MRSATSSSTTGVQPQGFNHGGSITGVLLALFVLPLRSMAKHFRELVAWQLAFELRELTKSGPASRDRRFCEQLNDSSRSVASNIAEGFGRYDPGDFARFLSIARGSLDETENHLRDGVASSYFPAALVGPLILKSARCRSAITSLQVYLRSAAAKQKANKNRSRTTVIEPS